MSVVFLGRDILSSADKAFAEVLIFNQSILCRRHERKEWIDAACAFKMK